MDQREQLRRDANALSALRAGDPEALSGLIGRYHDVVRGLVHRMGVQSPEDREDIVQEVFLRMHQSVHRYRDGYGLSAWILGIARNVTLMWLRRRQRDPVTVLPIVDRAIDDPPVAHAVHDLLERLPPRVRRVIEERYLKGRTYKEVARKLGLTEDQVDVALRKAKSIARRWQGLDRTASGPEESWGDDDR